ncbi:hypothetical protein K470DRAFT_277627 [Piedraia hortae CBS 480.64]|uniref:tRNA (guanine(9)-N1)-methyltransferase n=1 Tax=Piedraia hortae CBS 480.64 TaxID=1314780 RepID=A0A6A7BWK1_9PEZI|nr:hypothetical protein K470DRAFT_277627 [Piedraia hortae CBS 480.64]
MTKQPKDELSKMTEQPKIEQSDTNEQSNSENMDQPSPGSLTPKSLKRTHSQMESTSPPLGSPPLSKTQQKKLRKKAHWESLREERKVIRKAKQAARRQRKRQAKSSQPTDPLPPSDQNSPDGDQQGLLNETNPSAEVHPTGNPPPTKIQPTLLPVTIIIDCSFDSYMKPNEIVSLAAQITRAYSDNRKSACRIHLAISSFSGVLKERFENVLTHYRHWKGVRFFGEGFDQVAGRAGGWMTGPQGREAGGFPTGENTPHAEGKGDAGEEGGGNAKAAMNGQGRRGGDADITATGEAIAKVEGGRRATTATSNAEKEDGESEMEATAETQDNGEVVYLTSDAEETLTHLKPYSTYIVGGLVDKNREKGLCYRRAKEKGVRTARLPIGEFMHLKTRQVLATNHVVEIMLKWLECGDWGEAFVKAIPKRKGGTLKTEVREDGQGGGVHLEEDGVQGGGRGDDLNDQEDVEMKADDREKNAAAHAPTPS